MGHDFGEFWRALEWMGLQRHLKVLGIFCRLKHRDGKPAYAADLPRFFAYATRVALRYRALKPLIGLIEPMSGALTTTETVSRSVQNGLWNKLEQKRHGVFSISMRLEPIKKAARRRLLVVHKGDVTLLRKFLRSLRTR
jgi:hypothetical protein